MSLLMEALKKAEEAKRKAGEEQPVGSAVEPSAEEVELALLDDPPSVSAEQASSTLPPTRRTVPRSDESVMAAQQSAARNVFAAKQPVSSTKSSGSLWLFVGFGIFSAVLIAGYFWWQLRTPSQNSVRLAVPQPSVTQRAPSPEMPSPLSPQPVATPPSALPSTSTDTPASPETTPSSLPSTSLPTASVASALPSSTAVVSSPDVQGAVDVLPQPSAPTVQKARPAAVASRAEPASATASPSERSAPSPVRLSRNLPRTDSPLTQAYARLQAGDLDEAQKGYELVLRKDAKNTDALLGMATVASRKGQPDMANAYYLRALESDPSNPTAQAGILNAQGQANIENSESRLKTALSSHPDSTALLFALGNLYARQGRWSEAQQVYFQAYTLEPDNPDFMFNLAVSLDHLRQNKLAAQYYEMALNAEKTRPVSFDRVRIRNRLQELQP